MMRLTTPHPVLVFVIITSYRLGWRERSLPSITRHIHRSVRQVYTQVSQTGIYTGQSDRNIHRTVRQKYAQISQTGIYIGQSDRCKHRSVRQTCMQVRQTCAQVSQTDICTGQPDRGLVSQTVVI